MRPAFLLLCAALFAGHGLAATDVRFTFTLNTTDAYGAPLRQTRTYTVYRPDNLSRTAPVPLVVSLDGPAALHRKADEAGFVVVGCTFSGNSTGTPGTVWINDDPRIVGYEDFDYITEVIHRVKASDNTSDTFTIGLSKDGHMSLAYACERPDMIKAAASLDEFMGLTSNIPKAPVPILVFEGTLDTNVPYTIVRDTVDAWRAVDGLMQAAPVTTFESSARLPGKVTQTTWRGGIGGTQVAYITIIGGTHTLPLPTVETGYDYTDGMWAFFSQFLTGTDGAPKIVSQPVRNIQIIGQPASFWVTATGGGNLAYQWQKNGEDIPGATANWLTVQAVALNDNGAAYRAVIRNDLGTVTSAAATLTVNPPGNGPAIATQPADQAVVAGQPVTFSVAATGTAALRYQWTKNGVNIVGATAASYTIRAAILPDCGATFAVAVTDSAGSTTSSRATLTVSPAPGAPIMLKNVERARVLTGDTATFSVTAWSTSPMTYQWQQGTFTGNMTDIPGATEVTYTTPKATLSAQPPVFRCVVSNAAGSVTSASEMLFVTADPKSPSDITSPITAATQVGAPFTYTIVSSGGTTPVLFSADPLPAGLTLDAVTGRISGTPAVIGTAKINIGASNSAGTMSRVLTLNVIDTPPPAPMDAWRLAHFGAAATDPVIAGDLADPDGDGYTNLDEFIADTDPLDAASMPAAAGSSNLRRGSRLR